MRVYAAVADADADAGTATTEPSGMAGTLQFPANDG
jgi:hypothetical protein